MRGDGLVSDRHPSSVAAAAADGPDLSQMLVELASADLVSLEVDADGDITYALTARGEQTALLMAMSRQPHALVLLGALVSANKAPD